MSPILSSVLLQGECLGQRCGTESIEDLNKLGGTGKEEEKKKDGRGR